MNKEIAPGPELGTVHTYIEQTRHRQELRRLFSDFHPLFQYAPGSRGAHHFWYGGWMDHLQQMLDIYSTNYHWLQERGWLQELPSQEQFDQPDGYEVILMHDLEKPFKYAGYVQQVIDSELSPEWLPHLEDKTARKDFREELMSRYGIRFSPAQQNALHFVEGVRDADYIPGQRVDKPLASLCHAADDMSGRIGYRLRGPYYLGEIEPAGKPRQ